jgi:hypothetical protein
MDLGEIKGLVSTWITILQDGDYPVIESEEVQEVEKLINHYEECRADAIQLHEQNQRYKQALGEIVNIDGRFTAMDEEFDSNIAYDWVDEIARKALKE